MLVRRASRVKHRERVCCAHKQRGSANSIYCTTLYLHPLGFLEVADIPNLKRERESSQPRKATYTILIMALLVALIMKC